MNRQVIGCVAAVFSVLSAFAVERTWVGPETGGLWRDAKNWDPEGMIDVDDIPVFNREGTFEIGVEPSASPYNFLAGIKCEKGTVRIFNTGDSKNYKNYFRLKSAGEGAVRTNDFYVAGDAYLIMSNSVIANSSGRAAIRKTGAGTLEVNGNTWGETGWGAINGYVFAEGLVRARLKTADYFFQESNVVVGPQGKFKTNGNYFFGNMRMTVEKGGVYDASGNTIYLNDLNGDGVLTNVSAIQNFKLNHGVCRFGGHIYPSGTIATITMTAREAAVSEEDWKILLTSADAFSQVKFEMGNSTGAPLGFAAGVEGPFKVGQIQGNDKPTLHLEDEDGNPIAVRANFTNPAKFRATGSGSFTFTNGGSLFQNYTTTDISGMTGELGSTGAADVNFGNSTEASWPVFDERLSFRSEKVNGQPIYFKAPSTKTVTVPGCVSGNGTYGFYGKLLFLDMNTEGSWWQVRDNAELTITGGRSVIGGNGLFLYGGNKLTVANGAYVGGASKVPTYGFDGNVLKQNYGFPFDTGRSKGSMVVTNGGHVCSMAMANVFSAVDGGIVEILNGGDNVAASTWTFNGGELRLNPADAGFDFNVGPDKDGAKVVVGEKGMTLRTLPKTQIYSSGFMQFYMRSAVEGSGDVIRRGTGFVEFYRPLTISGEFANLDGTLRIPNKTAITDATVPLFGTGDFRLSNSRLEYHGNIAKVFAAKFGTGGKFIYEGAATIRVRESLNRPIQTLELGVLTQGEAGGALFFWDANQSDKSYNSSGANVSFTTAPALTDDGRIDQPVFTYANGKLDFASYTADDGLKAFTNYTYGFTGETAGKTVRTVANKQTHITADTEVGALFVDGKGINAYAENQAQLWIDAGKTLTVGQGAAPACVILSNGGSWTPAVIKGAGTLSFGGREGVVSATDKDGNYFATINAKIAGTRGVTFTRAATLSGNTKADLGGDNVYTGGTRIYGMRVSPKCAGAFSSGEVLVGNGELQGGTLYMDTEGLVLANKVKAAGWGSTTGDDSGAIQFAANGTISGAVEVYDEARFSAKSGVRGTFAGAISGEKVWIWKGAGEIAFAAANTCTGDVEIVGSTLVLMGAGTAGTGDIRLNNGTLVVESVEPKTVANRIYGKGVVRLGGKGSVTLGTVEAEGGTGVSLDLTKKVATINSLDGFSAITTSRTGATALIVADGKGKSFTGEVPENVTIYDPGEYTPPGLTLILR